MCKFLLKLIIKAKGPACFKREICVNECDFYSLDEIKTIPYNEFFSFDSPSNTLLLGDILYDIYYIPFLLAGILLLVSMLGSILLTLNFNRGGLAQDSSRQLSRSDKFLSFLK